jgi:hypothetical protein
VSETLFAGFAYADVASLHDGERAIVLLPLGAFSPTSPGSSVATAWTPSNRG